MDYQLFSEHLCLRVQSKMNELDDIRDLSAYITVADINVLLVGIQNTIKCDRFDRLINTFTKNIERVVRFDDYVRAVESYDDMAIFMCDQLNHAYTLIVSIETQVFYSKIIDKIYEILRCGIYCLFNSLDKLYVKKHIMSDVMEECIQSFVITDICGVYFYAERDFFEDVDKLCSWQQLPITDNSICVSTTKIKGIKTMLDELIINDIENTVELVTYITEWNKYQSNILTVVGKNYRKLFKFRIVQCLKRVLGQQIQIKIDFIKHLRKQRPRPDDLDLSVM